MEFIKDFLSGQKLFFADFLAPVNFILLLSAYFFGVGLARIFLKKDNVKKQNDSFWKVSNMTKKDRQSFLRQF